jgi:hypothetical protein
MGYGEKKKVANIEDSEDPSCLEANLSNLITRRILRRVAQSQYEPQGLLRLDMVKWQLLMRRVSMKERSQVGKGLWMLRKRKNSLVSLEQHV